MNDHHLRPLEFCVQCNREKRRLYSHKCAICDTDASVRSAANRIRQQFYSGPDAITTENHIAAIITSSLVNCVSITPSRLAELERAEAELKRISSCTPNTLRPGTPQEWRCSLCLALIDSARHALNYQPWPAIPHTPKVNP